MKFGFTGILLGLLSLSTFSRSQPLASGLATASDTFWLEAIRHQGISAFNNDSSYQVFRNVKDFGAVGDGVTDDTAAINNAISQLQLNQTSTATRCNLNSSTITPAVVYFPQGTYLVKTPIIAYYYTQLIGDPKNPPTLLADPSFNGIGVIDADPYGGPDGQWYVNTNNFFRSIRNFVIDVRQIPPTNGGTGIHWQVAQATSLMNIEFFMSDAPGSVHQGIWMENGSGGFMGDMVFHGGAFGLWVGNQQFTVRNVTIYDAQTAVDAIWGWGWTFQGVTIHNCSIGFDVSGASAEAIIDAKAYDTPIFLRSGAPSNGALVNSLVLNNIYLSNVTTAIGVTTPESVVLAGEPGGVMTLDSWVQGNVYAGTGPSGTFTQGDVANTVKPSAILTSTGDVFGKMHPQYEHFTVDQFVSVRDHGATGDGSTDDTAALQAVLNEHAGSKIVFVDAGTYIVTSTLVIPVNSRIVGEAWSVIAGSGAAFQDLENPKVVVQVGQPGDTGVVEITDIIFSTIGPAPGAIVVEWNVQASNAGDAGTWDTHIRLGGSAGTNLEIEQCAPTPGKDLSDCSAAFMALHLTPESSGYFEGMWLWTADHELDEDGWTLLDVFSARGVFSESKGPVWLIGTAEHHLLYQYQFLNAENHYIGLSQTETPYFQPYSGPTLSPNPHTANPAYGDPVIPPALSNQALATIVRSSSNLFFFGATYYSFYNDYDQTCDNTRDCQVQIVEIDSASSSIEVFSLATVASTYQIAVDWEGVVDQQDNNGTGFASTVSRWSSQ
ncbi:hypothetical protein HMN09_00037200 [Mycena chlorophos]|uniref:Rhamnogalacturonase A/B/Epimerase-like pectate lyase domain-containing protein n=1 Tax=Mycena chlorophos TaxID=658473 RepID=A0A8H6TTP9_MYCCL|nr:hypothetical protein HMN09_00037200 [Mycena chlorophos]